jgi:hypothetical protein
MNKGRGKSVGSSRKPTSGARSATNYEVGYGKPPKEHRFEPGQSGNRKGRPKGTKNTGTLLRELLDRKIEVRSGGAPRKISVREAILTRFAEAALKGDTKSAAFLFQRYDMLDEVHEPTKVTPDEQEIIDMYVKSYVKRRGSKT